MSDDDRQPIGRKGKKSGHRRGRQANKRHRRDDYDYDDFEDESNNDDENEVMTKKGNKSPQVKRRGKWVWLLLLKIFIVLTVLIVIYGFYLDNKIRHRIDGRVWELPAAVYGRMVNLEPGMNYNKAEMIRLLEGMQYRLVTKITRPGEFVVRGNSIEMLRRPFDFPDGKEGQIQARLVFDDNHLTSIENMENQRQFGFFRLDPKLISMMQSANGEQRLFVPRSGFPDLLVQTLLETEDRYFYEHDGIRPLSIVRAALENLLAGRAVQGGSTLTQQLVKNLFLTNERTLSRKANEALMALLLDARYSKDRILELYLNEVNLGQSGDEQIRGFPLASLYYFGRPIDELSLDQQALLVGMVKGASWYNPWRNPKTALERRNVVLKILQNRKVIDQELYDLLSARPLGVKPKSDVITPQPAFMQMVRKELQEKLGEKVNDLSGVKIFTTLDPVAQDAAEKAIEQGVADLRKSRKVPDLEGAMVIVDRFSGEVRAMVGGSQPQYAGFNRAMNARRLIGSLAKPATYLSALSQPDKYRLNTWLADEPISIPQAGGKPWEPKNFSRNFSGRVMLVDALARSINIPTVNLGLDVGLDHIANTLVLLGIPAKEIQKVPAMLLGAINLTPMEMAQEFQTIASGGNRARLSALRSIIAEDGTVVYQSYPQAERVVPAQAAYLTLYGMQQVIARGTGRSLTGKYGKYNLAGKTGTTNDLRDTWFTGIDGKEVAIVWAGRDNNGPTNLTGATGALKIYERYLANETPLALKNQPPEGIVDMSVNEDGSFNCAGGGIRILPVWTDDPQALCLQSVQQPIEEGKEEEAPGWLREMFGQ
ncbi:bifunctional glycosyl transferase/transpeptidase [Xenorhabdus cabanillasii]|uniref:Penicillin-binding protein 1B n=2 Tax=Xenorhabdus cabanillasii TaxID=351673 RepID=A0A3D9UL43_9GAMM|nr:bifunctional glycosyl transferase/transpeptidase [Xenorhabdus cabanillasii]PHM75715.1 penicillin-binding protein 1b [Xenorhabdus cabanillasii JM26]REF27315.1 penicillin-binding protein 1B [Xenorhabdus cabanillasii]CDL87507.1 Penicillin-binding protein 1B (Includes: Penicillin-insensitive transglycosylase; Penicillin-sensitive transpeptidase) [Xenorhabdus cabanillasii JM26]